MDADPDNLTPGQREAKAIHLWFTTDMSQSEIGDELGVTQGRISQIVNSEPSQEVQEFVDKQAAQVRVMALQELQRQLQEAGDRSRSAEKPVEVWEEDGYLHVAEDRDPETGELVDKYPIPAGYELAADHDTRYYRREEIREILDQMAELVGAKEPQEVEVSGSGIVIDMGDDNE